MSPRDTQPLLRHDLETGTLPDRPLSQTSRKEAARYDIFPNVPPGYSRRRYLAYYLPVLRWVPQYRLAWLRGDCVGALTVASLYIPMCFSFAVLGNVSPASGLYAFIVQPLVYALLGSSPLMIVGPEATGSLLVGAAVQSLQAADGPANEVFSGVATSLAGALLLSAGLAHLGFVESVLNPPFIQGFLGGVGFVLVVEQALPELGLRAAAQAAGVAHSSAAVKLLFILRHLADVHRLTALVAFSSLGFILSFRVVQKTCSHRLPALQLFPDRLVVLAVAAVLTWAFRLDQRGLDVLGDLGSSISPWPVFRWPLGRLDAVGSALSTSFVIALLGFFQSSVTARSLRPHQTVLRDTLHHSANRDLVALGVANLAGGCLSTLPAFGGFGRSKLNAQTGGLTPMSSLLLSAVVFSSLFFILPSLVYVPRPTLAAMASAVGLFMMEELPPSVRFFWRLRAGRELLLLGSVFVATVCYSMGLGIAVGGVLTGVQLLQHTTRSRIDMWQMDGRLDRAPRNGFDDDDAPRRIPDGCLAIRIPEPLTFINVGDFERRLRRLEHHGTPTAHPSQSRARSLDTCLLIDARGLTVIDACAVLVLRDTVQAFQDRRIQVVFARVRPAVLDRLARGGIVDLCGGPEYFLDSVQEALKMARARF